MEGWEGKDVAKRRKTQPETEGDVQEGAATWSFHEDGRDPRWESLPEAGSEGAAFGLDGMEVTVISASAAGGVRGGSRWGGEETEPRVQTGL